ncbi:MAG: hypothetical protein JSW41_03950 [Candidatus Aenigmatarchaeota archaeon]|nr:MAG: hypothetical protein JSW41_03950 [Candidatus Aenigmarchaeota archaeon]
MSDLKKIQEILDDPEALKRLEVTGEWQEDIEEIYQRLYGDGDAGLDTDVYNWKKVLRRPK